jgi:hypothetical protein
MARNLVVPVYDAAWRSAPDVRAQANECRQGLLRPNRLFDTDAYVRPLPSVAPDPCAGQRRR